MSYADMICRFINSDGSVRLNLNNPGTDPTKTGGGWYIARGGLDIGVKTLERAWLGQIPYGSMLAATAAPPVEMRLKLLMAPQTNATAMQSLFNSLNLELRQPTNILEFRPPGLSSSYYADTWKADEPSIMRANEVPNVFKLLQIGQPLEVVLFREPNLRGAGVMV